MILRADGDHLVLVRQSDHALLSGWLAAAWGAPPWRAPEPWASTVTGARLHDLAWVAFDETLPLRPDGRPYAFHEVSRAVTTRLYRRGIEAVAAIDEYAGLLTSLHLSGFFTSHWGWRHVASAAGLDRDEREAVERFVHEEAARQRRLRERLGIAGELDRRLMCAYVWLQLWDFISLDVCRRGFTGWSADYPAAPVGADRVSLHIELEPGGVCRLDPYPLLASPYRARLPAVRVPAALAADAGALREAWRSGGDAIEVTFQPGRG